MSALLYHIPAALLARYHSGEVGLFGAVLKNLATGQIVGHVQQTSATDGLIRWALGTAISASPVGMIANTIGGVAGFFLNGVTVWQNEQIKSRLTAVQESLTLLQGMQMGGLLLSGVGLGVSVAGFAMMNAKLNSIGAAIAKLDDKIAAVTAVRREDDLQKILQSIDTHLTTVDGLGDSRKQRQQAAERAEEGLRQDAGQLHRVLRDEVDLGIRSDGMGPDLDRVMGLAAMYRLAHEASTRALLMIDEVEEAGRLSGIAGERLMTVTSNLVPDDLARRRALQAKTPDEAIDARRRSLDTARGVVNDLRQSALIIASQQDLAKTLKDRGVSGLAYLQAVAEPDAAPFRLFPAAALDIA